jgi:hypothetical protein
MGLFFPLAVAFVAPLVAALVPKFIYRQGLSVKANHVMLGVSAGLLFAIATLDLVPEAFSMTSQVSFAPSPPSAAQVTADAGELPHELVNQMRPPARRLAAHGDGPPLGGADSSSSMDGERSSKGRRDGTTPPFMTHGRTPS